VKIARAREQLAEQHGAVDEPMRDEVRDALLLLQLAVHLEQTRFEQRVALLAPHPFPDDDVDLAALVLEREKGDATRGRRPLAQEHDAGGTHPRAVAERLELAGAEER
jgi:hypothetical protein